jgi:hypothetical protein
MTDTADLFEIVFRGDIASGADLGDVKKRLQALFKADAARIDRMFSGRPVVIRSGLNQADVTRYKQAMEKSGAMVQVRPVYGASDAIVDSSEKGSTKGSSESSTKSSAKSSAKSSTAGPQPAAVEKSDQNIVVSEPEPEPEPVSSGDDWGITPVGADVLQDNEKRHFEDRDVDTSSISLTPSGTNVLNEDERIAIEDQDIDTSHLDLDS